MKFIEIAPLENGAHENLEILEGSILDMPDFETWAFIPAELTIPSSYPFVDITTEKQLVVNNNQQQEVNVVTSMSEKEVPTIESPEKESSIIDDMMAMMVDQEYRLTLLEAKG